MRTDTPPTIFLKDYQPPAFLVDEVTLCFELSPDRTVVKSRLAMRPNPAASNSDGALVLDGEKLELLSVVIDGEKLAPEDYSVSETELSIANAPQAAFVLEVETRCNPEGNTALSGLYRSSGTYCTQCEAEGFRRITYFPDRPDVLSRYTVRIEADKAACPVLLSNGNLIESGDLDGGGRHFAVWQDPHPKPSYLFALVAGDLADVSDQFITMSGRKVDLKIFVEHGKEDRCDWAMSSLKTSMKWDEEAFGREYDLDIFMIVAVSDFNMGAMENKGLNIFNDKYILALPETATDQDFANIEAIIAHEYFHNWSGNRITCRDWFQLCLKEGLTVFRDQEFSSDLRSRPVKRISDVRLLRSHQFPEDAGPLAHPVRPQSYMEINNFYTATVYEKGAEIVRMIKTLIGADAFAAGMTLYFDRHDGEAATVEDFIGAMADASGRDLTRFFNWYNFAGTPELVANGKWDANKQEYLLSITQKTPDTPGQQGKPPFHIPLKLGLVGPDGNDMALELDGKAMERPVIELTSRSQTFRFTNVISRPVPSLNRNFSAPVNLTSNLGEERRIFLLANDSDPFNRWEAGQKLGRDFILSAVRGDLQRQGAFKSYCKALKAVLDDRTLEPAFQALMLALPGETDIAGVIAKNVDPLKIHEARETVLGTIGASLMDRLRQVYEDLGDGGDYSPDAASAGKRALKQACLSLIASADSAAGADLAYNLYRASTHMTGKAGALNVLARMDCPQREDALTAFYDQFKQDHLVVDKWLTFNAIQPDETASQSVRALLNHTAFKMTQPNKVRALIGSFASLNPVGFNASDGSGYKLVADILIELDKLNPQTTARLSACFKSWRSLEPKRRALAEAQLERIKAIPQLSRDTLEMVTRTLD